MLRRLPTSRLLALLALVLVVLGGGTAIAVAALNGSGATPPAKPLDAAIHDAVAAPPVDGVTARITFTNRLIDKSSVGGGSPLLSGATGRLWAAADGRLRLELQSDSGDAQVTSDGKTVTVVDATQNQAYKITLPKDSGTQTGGNADTPPTLARIDEFLRNLAADADVSGAQPSNVAGREAYTVRVSPKHDGGLIGAGELAWDAANGIPLRAAVYAAGDPRPVLELEATEITFGKVADSDLSAPVQPGMSVTNVDLGGQDQAGAPAGHGKAEPTNDPNSVAKQLPFTLSAPDTLVGLPRKSVRAITHGDTKAALVTYGAGLGGIAVIEEPADATAGAPTRSDHGLQLPKISIGGTDGQELATALGTMVRFARGGVQYTVIGSVPPNAAEAAARAL